MSINEMCALFSCLFDFIFVETNRIKISSYENLGHFGGQCPNISTFPVSYEVAISSINQSFHCLHLMLKRFSLKLQNGTGMPAGVTDSTPKITLIQPFNLASYT